MKFVFCEGGDDQAVISGLLGFLASRIVRSEEEVDCKDVKEGTIDLLTLGNIRVESFGGKDKLRRFLRNLHTRPEFSTKEVESFGIIRDADQDGRAAFQSVRDALQACDFEAPNLNGGISNGRPRVGVLIISPGNGQGMIEDVCLQSVSEKPEFCCVDQYFRCITQKSGRTNFSSKAKVRVWMASQVDFEAHVGVAARRGYWPWEDTSFDPIKQFLRQL